MIGGVLQGDSSPFLPIQPGKRDSASPNGAPDPSKTPAPGSSSVNDRSTGQAGTDRPGNTSPASGKAAATQQGTDGKDGGKTQSTGKTQGSGKDQVDGQGDGSTDSVQLSPQAQAEVSRLKQVDASVRAHEAAHQAAGGPLAGGATFQFQRGPDGKNYAVGGEVPIDMSRGSTPEATIAKMQTVKAAAMAPSDPSGQDRSVAAAADALMSEAQRELSQKRSAVVQNGFQKGGKADDSTDGTFKATGTHSSSDRASQDVTGASDTRGGPAAPGSSTGPDRTSNSDSANGANGTAGSSAPAGRTSSGAADGQRDGGPDNAPADGSSLDNHFNGTAASKRAARAYHAAASIGRNGNGDLLGLAV